VVCNDEVCKFVWCMISLLFLLNGGLFDLGVRWSW
jgi:hypothetical protein